MKIKRFGFVFSLTLIALPALFYGCGDAPTPRPYGYFRVDLPAHRYIRFDSVGLPYTFDKSASATVIPRAAKGENYWIDISYKTLNANIYGSYKPVKSDLYNLLEDTRSIVYKHDVRADAITETPFENRNKRVFGILYDLSGNTASPVQFIVTDSTRHFFRGALYFENVPNKDSIAPMAEYVREDIVRMIESFEWKK